MIKQIMKYILTCLIFFCALALNAQKQSLCPESVIKKSNRFSENGLRDFFASFASSKKRFDFLTDDSGHKDCFCA